MVVLKALTWCASEKCFAQGTAGCCHDDSPVTAFFQKAHHSCSQSPIVCAVFWNACSSPGRVCHYFGQQGEPPAARLLYQSPRNGSQWWPTAAGVESGNVARGWPAAGRSALRWRPSPRAAWPRPRRAQSAAAPAPRYPRARPSPTWCCGEKNIWSAQTMQVAARIPVRVQLCKAGVGGPTPGLARASLSPADVAAQRVEQRVVAHADYVALVGGRWRTTALLLRPAAVPGRRRRRHFGRKRQQWQQDFCGNPYRTTVGGSRRQCREWQRRTRPAVPAAREHEAQQQRQRAGQAIDYVPQDRDLSILLEVC